MHRQQLIVESAMANEHEHKHIEQVKTPEH